MSNGAMTEARIDEIRRENEQALQEDGTGRDHLIEELLDAIAYERGVCTTQARVIKKLHARLEGPDD